MNSADLRPLLAYLKDLGWDQVYRSEPGAAAPSTDDGDRLLAPREPSDDRLAPMQSPDAEREVAVSSTTDDGGFEGANLVTLGGHAESCVACPLSEGRTKVVFGSGSETADLMFIGEGPGYHEDQQGLPFVGRAGELLTRIINAIELEREAVYIANIVKCRPPNNRDPKPDEVAACIGYLRRQIELIEPKVIVALGRVAAQTLLESSAPIGRLRGSWHEYRGVALRATYHPAALLRNNSLKRPTWEDMQVVRDFLLSRQ